MKTFEELVKEIVVDPCTSVEEEVKKITQLHQSYVEKLQEKLRKKRKVLRELYELLEARNTELAYLKKNRLNYKDQLTTSPKEEKETEK